MEVLLLGTGSADGWPNPFCSCSSCAAAQTLGLVRGQTAALVDGVLLLDCGPEAPRAAAREGRDLHAVRDILLTHSHPDHTGPGALLWRSWAGRTEPLTIHGPAQALDACRDWAGPKDPVTFHEVVAGDRFSTSEGHQVTALAATHGDAGSGPGLLWEVTDPKQRRLLYATDTGWPSADTLGALEAAQPYDLVLLEETFGDCEDLGTDHLDLTSFAALVGRLRAAGTLTEDTQVVAVHLGHHNPAPDELDRRLGALGARAGRDGEVITVGSQAPDRSPRTRTLVLGGARSGKSLTAERLLAADPEVTYVATGGKRAGDEEWEQRVRIHQERRPSTWTTVETTDVAAVLVKACERDSILVDCLTLWLADCLDRAGTWSSDPSDLDAAAASAASVEAEIDALLGAVRATEARVVLVSNEVGQGVVPGTRSGRDFRDELGRLNARVADAVDDVTFVVAGQALTLKGTR